MGRLFCLWKVKELDLFGSILRDDYSNEVYLWDMLDACEKIQFFVSNKSWHDFEKDLILRHAIKRLLEILGEAARCVSEEFKCEHPEIPWKGIIGQRHVIAHEYAEIQYERIWKIAIN